MKSPKYKIGDLVVCLERTSNYYKKIGSVYSIFQTPRGWQIRVAYPHIGKVLGMWETSFEFKEIYCSPLFKAMEEHD